MACLLKQRSDSARAGVADALLPPSLSAADLRTSTVPSLRT